MFLFCSHGYKLRMKWFGAYFSIKVSIYLPNNEHFWLLCYDFILSNITHWPRFFVPPNLVIFSYCLKEVPYKYILTSWKILQNFLIAISSFCCILSYLREWCLGVCNRERERKREREKERVSKAQLPTRVMFRCM